MQAALFVDRWRDLVGGAERADYQLFLRELTSVLDVPPPDPASAATGYRFEYPVRGDAGQPRRIDLYRRDRFILEAKQSRLKPDKHEASTADLFAPAGVGHNSGAPDRRPDPYLRPAFHQAWDYANRLESGHERPPFIVTCDVGRRFELYADFSGQGRDYRPWSGHRVVLLEDLLDAGPRDELTRVWTEPQGLNPALRRAAVTREVAAHVAELSRSLEADGRPPEEVATFIARCLFAAFAQTVGLLPSGSFSAMLGRCLESPATFMGQAQDLFARMDEGGFSAGLNAEVVRFNGAFFKDRRAFPLRREQIGTLIEAASKDWRHVEPAIFGTLIEQALSPAERSRLGAHYTPRPYVETLVAATVMEPLREEWDAARAAAADLRTRGDAKGAVREVSAFAEKLSSTRILDPACGTGNFLYVALERMKALEAEVLAEMEALGAQGALRLERLDPRTFLGLELNPRAAAIAELVLWIGYLQAVWRHGDAASTPVLRDYGNIRRGDAVLTPDRRARPVWPDADYIVGNPPFIGGKDLRRELGDDYARALWAAHPHMNESADLVMYWWDRAAEILTRRGTRLQRFGLVTSNSIRQVFGRRTVARWLSAKPPLSLSLTFAVDDHPWTKATRDAAAVRIAMTVARAGRHDGVLATVRREAALDTDAPVIEFGRTPGRINADLTVGVDVTTARPLLASEGLCSPGVKLHGSGFIVSPKEAAHLGLGRPDRPRLERHIRPYLNGRDLTGRSRGALVIDLFGLSAEEVRNRFPEVYSHLSQTVRVERRKQVERSPTADAQAYAASWWLFGKPRQQLRSALESLERYMATIETSKHRTFSFVDRDVLADNMLVVIASEDAAHLAVLSSTLHGVWASAQGATLEDRPRYSKSRCFDPFPFPAWTEVQRDALARAGEALDAFRKSRLAETPALTLTRLYNALEAWRAERAGGSAMGPQEAADAHAGSVPALHDLHAEIDALTLDAYGWTPDEAAETGLARLVALNAERVAEEAGGQVRWLRPAYQASRYGRGLAAGPETAGDLVDQAGAPVAGGRERLPPSPTLQALIVKGALAEAGRPLRTADLAARFKGRRAALEVERTLGALLADGQLRRAPDGAWSLVRGG